MRFRLLNPRYAKNRNWAYFDASYEASYDAASGLYFGSIKANSTGKLSLPGRWFSGPEGPSWWPYYKMSEALASLLYDECSRSLGNLLPGFTPLDRKAAVVLSLTGRAYEGKKLPLLPVSSENLGEKYESD